MRYPLACLALFVAAGPAAAQDQFLLRRGNDTISIERFRRTPTHLHAELLLRAGGVRTIFDGPIGPGVTIPRLESRFWLAADDTAAAPRQSAVLEFRGDSVVAEIASGANRQTQRLGTQAGALPHINPSFALMELAILRARTAGVAEVPFFAVAGGATFTMKVEPLGPDSVLLSAPGSDARVRVDAQSRILGAVIPAQRINVERVSGGGAAMGVAKPDYSAPAGAPYSAQDVTIPTPMGHQLAGTLTMPRGASAAAPVPAIITITGSGLQDRDERLPPFPAYAPFRELADSLGRRGIAVLRMDDRGFGGSGGNGGTATSADFAADIAAGLAWLRARRDIDGRRLGLVGHSEGGLIAPMVAKGDGALGGIVLMAGPAKTGRTILEFQIGNSVRNDTSLSAAARDSVLKTVPARVDSMLTTNPWLRFFGDYDPLATASAVTTPVLIINGGTDQQVTPDQVAALETAFKAAGNRDVTARVFPNLNHLFVPDPDGFPGRYGELPSFKVDRSVIGLVADWLAARLLKPAS
ncbi:MAG: alpha/beta hydrolase family protein [Gemmatimonadales bacterium]